MNHLLDRLQRVRDWTGAMAAFSETHFRDALQAALTDPATVSQGFERLKQDEQAAVLQGLAQFAPLSLGLLRTLFNIYRPTADEDGLWHMQGVLEAMLNAYADSLDKMAELSVSSKALEALDRRLSTLEGQTKTIDTGGLQAREAHRQRLVRLDEISKEHDEKAAQKAAVKRKIGSTNKKIKGLEQESARVERELQQLRRDSVARTEVETTLRQEVEVKRRECQSYRDELERVERHGTREQWTKALDLLEEAIQNAAQLGQADQLGKLR